MSQDLLSAIGARLEARLNALDARTISVEDSVKAHVAANPPAPFTLPDGTKQFAYAPTGGDYTNRPAAFTPAVNADHGVGATFRRHGVGTDAPMSVTRVGDGVVFADYTDSEGTREVAFYPNQLDLVTKAQAMANTDYVAPATSPQAVASAVTPAAFAQVILPPPIVAYATPVQPMDLHPNGTPVAYTPAVQANYGVGATIRRAGVMGDTPMTVTRVGNGVVFANFTDSEGTREIAFHPNQVDLVTAAP